jgi:hypothetical protein
MTYGLGKSLSGIGKTSSILRGREADTKDVSYFLP